MKVHDKDYTGKNLAELAAHVFNKQVDTAVITSIPAQEGSGLVNHSPPPSSKNQKEMIDPKSLRIGNRVHHKSTWSYRQPDEGPFNAFDFNWEERDWLAIGESCLNFNDLEPIPLSEQELIRLGFRKVDSETALFDYVNIKNGWFALSERDEFFKYCLPSGTVGSQFQYVHQLQNLYYSLTGTELTYKVENETIKP